MTTGQTSTLPPKKEMPQIGAILAVASGKGGVGKSTIAVNLALAFHKIGKRVGLLDADIYGPSQHIMLGMKDKTPVIGVDQRMEVLESHGISLMSFGFFVKPEQAVIWRGPMMSRMLQQLIEDVNWPELDILVIDLPPGTGDAQLTLTQFLHLSGAVIVSTPQDVALADAVKGVNMFQSVDVPVLGLIENMSFFQCTQCGHEAHIFSHGGAKQKAGELGVKFLGELPLEESTRTCGDEGIPVVVKEPDGKQAQRFIQMAKDIIGDLKKNSKKPKPVLESRETQDKKKSFAV